MRTRVWCMSLVLAALGVACGDQTTEVNVEQETVRAAGMAKAPGMTADATATSDDGLVISTDKDDYQPGDTVHFTGSGWSANDTLDILLEDEPATHEPHTWWVPVGEDGTFRDSTYVVDIGDLDVTFTLTTTSRSTGRTLAVTFTDGQPQDVTLTPVSPSVPPGTPATYNVNVNMVGNDNPCTINLEVTAGLPAGTPTSFSGNPFILPEGSGNSDITSVLTITTSGLPTGNYSFTVRATRGEGCQGTAGTGPTATGTLVVFGPATKLAFGQQPTTEQSLTPISPAVTVRVLDDNSNLVLNSSAQVTLAIGTNPGGGTLGGTLTQNAVNGVATFSNLTIDKAGNGYTLVATSTGLTPATSNAFEITVGAATKLAFVTQPSGGAPNSAFATQPRVEVQDAGGNRKTTGSGSGASVTLAIVPGSGTAGAVLTCTTNPLTASAGLATFAGCRINLAGTGYRLRATSGSLTAADSDPFNVTAANQPPNVNAGGPYTVKEGTELTLTPTVIDPDNDPLTYTWNVVTTGIDAGGACTFDNQAAKNAKITCTDDSDDATGAKFTLTLTVDDGTAPPVSGNADLKVTNENPTADAGASYPAAAEGSPIQLAGSGDDPGDNDDSHLGYHWTVDDSGITSGGSCEFDNAASKNAKVTCDDNGSAIVSLVVSDDDGGTSAASTATVTFTNADPVADAGPDYDGDEGEVIPLNGTVSDAGANDVLTWSWAYAPGSNVDPGAECTFSDENAIDPTISCTDDGEVTLTLTVNDDDGGMDSDTAILTLSNVAPVANAGGPYNGAVEGTAINLNGLATDAGTNDSHTFQWTVDDSGIDGGGTCTLVDTDLTNGAAQVTCDDNGTLKMSLVATDDDGLSSVASQVTIAVANANPEITAFTQSDANSSPLPETIIVAGTLGLKVVFDDDGTNDTHTLEVDCGSGTFSAPPVSATSPKTSSCTFPTIGSKIIRVKIADDDADATSGFHIVSHTILVKYDFDGFYAPVDRPNTMNVSKAGQAIPLKWTLRDANGAPVTDVATVTVKTVAMSCQEGSTTDPLEEYAGSTSGLINFGDGRYQYNWKTATNLGGTCKSIALVFATGGVSYTEGPHAFFSFKK